MVSLSSTNDYLGTKLLTSYLPRNVS
jgi:hypothetical protein